MEAKLGNEVLRQPTAGQTGETSTNRRESADYQLYGEYVVGFIDSEDGKAPGKKIVQALTGENSVPKGLFKDIMDDLRGMESQGILTSTNGKYYTNESEGEDGSSPQTRRVKINNNPTQADKEKLAKIMQRELGDPVVPHKRRRRRANPNPRNYKHRPKPHSKKRRL